MSKSWEEILASALKRAAKDMGSALAAHYPQDDDDRQPEAYMTTHLARALGAKAHLYPEYRVDESGDSHGLIDLVVYLEEVDTFVAIEFKNLSHSSKDFESFAKDIAKLDTFKLKGKTVRRAIVASTWWKDIAESWKKGTSSTAGTSEWSDSQEAFFDRAREGHYGFDLQVVVGSYTDDMDGFTPSLGDSPADVLEEPKAVLFILAAMKG